MSKILETAKANVKEKEVKVTSDKKVYTKAQMEAQMAFIKLQDLKEKLGDHSEWSLNNVTL